MTPLQRAEACYALPGLKVGPRAVLLYLAHCDGTHGAFPSRKDIASSVGLCVSAVKTALRTLEGNGYIKTTQRANRTSRYKVCYERILGARIRPPAVGSETDPRSESDPGGVDSDRGGAESDPPGGQNPTPEQGREQGTEQGTEPGSPPALPLEPTIPFPVEPPSLKVPAWAVTTWEKLLVATGRKVNGSSPALSKPRLSALRDCGAILARLTGSKDPRGDLDRFLDEVGQVPALRWCWNRGKPSVDQWLNRKKARGLYYEPWWEWVQAGRPTASKKSGSSKGLPRGTYVRPEGFNPDKGLCDEELHF